jgi:hypothetical protein
LCVLAAALALLAGTGVAAQDLAVAARPGALPSADCARPTATLARDETQPLPAGMPGSFAMELDEIERIELDLAAGAPMPGPAPAAALEICDPAGVPIAGEPVPGPDGHVILQFTAPAAGRYVVAVAAGDAPRSLALRVPQGPAADATPLTFGRPVFAHLVPRARRLWSFEGKAGQWVRIAATSDGGAALRLALPEGAAAPDPRSAGEGESFGGESSEGREPQITRKLPVDGVYRIEVRALGDAPDDLTLDVRELAFPPPPAASADLHPGTALRGTMSAEGDARLYDIALQAGRSYEVEAAATFDLALDIGLADPLEPAGGTPASGISVLRTADASRSGSEIIAFSAASDGHVVLRVRGLGVFEGGEDYTLMLRESAAQVPSNSTVRTAPSAR